MLRLVKIFNVGDGWMIVFIGNGENFRDRISQRRLVESYILSTAFDWMTALVQL